MMGSDWGSGWMGFGVFGMVLFWGAIIAAIVGLTTAFARGRGGGIPDGSASVALQGLQERYARGEIDLSEYERQRRELAG